MGYLSYLVVSVGDGTGIGVGLVIAVSLLTTTGLLRAVSVDTTGVGLVTGAVVVVVKSTGPVVAY
jgi:hypothetical protein